MRWMVLLGVLAACNQVWGLDETRVRDLEPPRCSTIQFGPPVDLPDFVGAPEEFDSQLSADGLEIWFTANTTGSFLLYRGVRASTTAPFATQLTDLVGRNPENTFDAALTADGRRMMFIVDGAPTQLFEGVREDAAQFPFTRIVLVNGFAQFPTGVRSFDLTWDGLRIYFVVGDSELWFAERPTRDAPFENLQMLFPSGFHFITVSGDELEIYYTIATGDDRLFRRARPDRDSPFGDEVFVLDEGVDPDIAPTSSTLLVSRGGGLSILERDCDED